MATVQLWKADAPLDEPYTVGPVRTAPLPFAEFCQRLESDGWQHVGDGPEGARVFACPDTLVMFEVTP